jgi:beta-glucanase (GH16 family)
MKCHGLLAFAALFAFSLMYAEATPDGWKLVWADEFDAPGAPDPAKWVYETGMLRNGEAQLYTENRPENVRIEDGSLVIEAHKETLPVPGKEGKSAAYSSGSIHTRGKANWLYGRIEVKAKIPSGRGMWPAIWMMPSDSKAGWPACGEIDIMEYVGFQPDVIHGTVHTADYNHVKKTQKGSTIQTPKPEETFHVYAIEWDAQSIRFYFDEKLYFTFANEGKGAGSWPFDKAFYLKLNSAVGGGWGGQKGIDDTIFPRKFLIDYVRVYQREEKP